MINLTNQILNYKKGEIIMGKTITIDPITRISGF